MKSDGDSEEEEKPSQSRKRKGGRKLMSSQEQHDYQSDESNESSDHVARSRRNLKASQKSKMSTRNKGSVSQMTTRR